MDRFISHLNDDRYAGVLDNAHGRGAAGDPACGAVFDISLRFDKQKIAAARFLASGSAAAVACGSALTGLITGCTWREVAALSAEALAAEVGEAKSKPEILTAASFAVEALHAAIEDALRRGTFPRSETQAGSIIVAMSGGVDSSVACLLARKDYADTIGLTMRLWSDPACGEAEGSCCSPQAVRDARAVCHQLGIPHLTVDLRDEFRETVVKDFLDAHVAGLTPNPCALCNSDFRFPWLSRLADVIGAARVASGHYARIAGDPPELRRAADEAKDQSYMLWGVAAADLKRLDLPLGGLQKDEVRRLAAGAGLATHDRPESQDICFIPDNDHRSFLKRQLPEHPGCGDIIDTSGRRLGSHAGYLDYTVGQRRGLGGGAAEPLYVLRTEPESNTVVAGPRDELAVYQVGIEAMVSSVPLSVGERVEAQLRYNSLQLPAVIEAIGEGRCRLRMEKPAIAVAPGQSAVMYRGDRLLAGGIIAECC
jgi:tRNA-specific 2-thiouridylase